jgi:membrane-bound acyltransferase YfiQ involved in biofilm formation
MGQADYHLYFVIMILQIYVLFPLLWWGMKFSEKGTLVLSLIVQICLYLIYGYAVTNQSSLPILLNDQKEYIFALSWIFYFVLGMYLGKNPKRISKKIAVVLLLGGMIYVIASVVGSNSVDLVSLLRFTKISIMAYASGLIVLLFSLSSPVFVFRILRSLGTNSYLIYLCHPLLFRIILGIIHQNVAFSTLFVALSLYGFALFLSLKTRLRSAG